MRRFITVLFLVVFIITLALSALSFAHYFGWYSAPWVPDVFDRAVEQAIERSGPLVSRKPMLGDITRSGVIDWTNRRRLAEGVDTQLVPDASLHEAAAARVDDMFEHQYFAHESPSGVDASAAAKAAGYSYITIGENLARGGFAGNEDMVNQWMNSPGHRENILNPQYSEIGVAARSGEYRGDKMWIAVQVFGRPERECAHDKPALSSDVLSRRKAALDADVREIERMKQELEEFSETNPSSEEYNERVRAYNQEVRAYRRAQVRYNDVVQTHNTQLRTYQECINAS